MDLKNQHGQMIDFLRYCAVCRVKWHSPSYSCKYYSRSLKNTIKRRNNRIKASVNVLFSGKGISMYVNKRKHIKKERY